MSQATRNRHGIYTYLIILVVVTIINSLLSHFAVVAWPICSERVAYFSPKGRPICSEKRTLERS